MDPTTIGVIGITALVVLIMAGVPVGIAMAIVGFGGFSLVAGLDAALGVIKTVPYTTLASYSLSVIPFFVLMGQVVYYAGISEDLFSAAYKWLGRLPGGLAMSTVVACALFGAICGSSPATAATMGTVALPAMKEYKYEPSLSAACVACAGSLGIMIPPSIGLMVYGIITMQSISKLFIAGIMPGILLASLFILVIFFLVKRKPEIGPPGPSCGLKEKLAALVGVRDVVILFLVVIGGMFAGLFTPTEAAAVGAFGSLVLAALRKKLTYETLVKSLLDTSRVTAMIFLILIGAMMLGYFFAATRLPSTLAELLSSSHLPRHIILAGILLTYIFLGCIMDSLAMILLTVPIFYPVILNLGFDPIWFGVIVVMVMEQGLITPPVGLNCYVVAGLDKTIPLETVFKGILPLWAAIIVGAIILTVFPQIATFLPNLLR